MGDSGARGTVRVVIPVFDVPSGQLRRQEGRTDVGTEFQEDRDVSKWDGGGRRGRELHTAGCGISTSILYLAVFPWTTGCGRRRMCVPECRA
jgi:hypothetical protein